MIDDDTRRYERLYERYQEGDISRRTFLRLLGVAGVAAGVVGGPFGFMTRDAWAEVKQIRYDDWGGVVEKAEKKSLSAIYQKNGYQGDNRFLWRRQGTSGQGQGEQARRVQHFQER
jgi:hypothetical protein